MRIRRAASNAARDIVCGQSRIVIIGSSLTSNQQDFGTVLHISSSPGSGGRGFARGARPERGRGNTLRDDGSAYLNWKLRRKPVPNKKPTTQVNLLTPEGLDSVWMPSARRIEITTFTLCGNRTFGVCGSRHHHPICQSSVGPHFHILPPSKLR